MSDAAAIHDSTGLAATIRKAPAAAQFAALALIAALAFPHAIGSMAGLWIQSSTYHHGFVVFPLAVWLVWRERDAFAPPAPSMAAALATGPLAALLLAGRAAGANIAEHLTFISLLICIFAVAFGVANARRASFSLAFLYFAAPFGSSLTPALQAATASSVVLLLAATGVVLERDGALIRTSAGHFEIADACAGLNFLLAALLVSAVFAGVAFRSWKKRLAFLALAAVTSLLANILRAFLVIFLATKTPLGMDFARDHAGFGWALYAAFLVGLIAIGRRLRDDPRPLAAAPNRLFEPTPISRAVIVAALMLAGAAALDVIGLPGHAAALLKLSAGL